MRAVKRSSFLLVVIVFALLLLTSMAAGGRKMLINKHQVRSMVEIQVRKIYCINRMIPTLPINLDVASRSEA